MGAVHRSKRPKLAARPGGMSPKLKPVLKLLNELLRHQYVGPFAAPVDPRIYPSYYEGPRAVADPIDLGSIKKNLEAGAYANADAVKTDVDRVWANCRQYNGEESEIARMAETLEGLFDEKMATIPQELEAEEHEAKKLQQALEVGDLEQEGLRQESGAARTRFQENPRFGWVDRREVLQNINFSKFFNSPLNPF